MSVPYYQDEAVKLYHGDALVVMETLPAASIDLVLVDPPYYRVKAEAWDRQWKSVPAYLDWICALGQQWRRLLKPNGSLYCFASPEMAAQVEITLGRIFQVLNQIVWQKANGNANWRAPKEEVRGYLPNTERIIFAEQFGDQYAEMSQSLHKAVYAPLGRYIQTERERAGFTRDQVDVGLGYVRTKNPDRGTELCRRWEEGSSLPTQETYERLRELLNTRNGGEYLRQEYEDLRQEYEDLRQEYEDLRRPFFLTPQRPYTDVWTFPTVQPAPGKHPCEKPLSLLEHIITVSSRPGAVVLDCCAGSGSTLRAAKNLGRQCIAIEQAEQWCRYAKAWLAQESFIFA